MAVLWLRFLTEINSRTEEAPAKLLENPAIAKALTMLEKSAYSEAQLLAYDRFWDAVYRERVFYDDGFRKGEAKGRAEGEAKGIEEANRKNAQKMKSLGMSEDIIAQVTGLSINEIHLL